MGKGQKTPLDNNLLLCYHLNMITVGAWIVGIIIFCAACWYGLKFLLHVMFTTPVGAMLAFGWGAVWGIAGAEHFGWLPYTLVSWAAIPAFAHVLGWLAGLGAALFAIALAQNHFDDTRVIAFTTVFTLCLLPAIVVAWSMYFGFIVTVILAIGIKLFVR